MGAPQLPALVLVQPPYVPPALVPAAGQAAAPAALAQGGAGQPLAQHAADPLPGQWAEEDRPHLRRLGRAGGAAGGAFGGSFPHPCPPWPPLPPAPSPLPPPTWLAAHHVPGAPPLPPQQGFAPDLAPANIEAQRHASASAPVPYPSRTGWLMPPMCSDTCWAVPTLSRPYAFDYEWHVVYNASKLGRAVRERDRFVSPADRAPWDAYRHALTEYACRRWQRQLSAEAGITQRHEVQELAEAAMLVMFPLAIRNQEQQEGGQAGGEEEGEGAGLPNNSPCLILDPASRSCRGYVYAASNTRGGWDGYTEVRVGPGLKDKLNAHRFMLYAMAGVPPEARLATSEQAFQEVMRKQHAMHLCRNRRCCNWLHLCWGPQADNNKHSSKKTDGPGGPKTLAWQAFHQSLLDRRAEEVAPSDQQLALPEHWYTALLMPAAGLQPAPAAPAAAGAAAQGAHQQPQPQQAAPAPAPQQQQPPQQQQALPQALAHAGAGPADSGSGSGGGAAAAGSGSSDEDEIMEPAEPAPMPEAPPPGLG